MNLQVAIWRTEAKLAFLLAFESIILSDAATVLIVQFPMFLLLAWIVDGGPYLKPIAAYIVGFLAVMTKRAMQLRPEKSVADVPLSKPLDSYPALHALVNRTASLCRKPAPSSVSLSLSPRPWHRLGVDLRDSEHRTDTLTIPIVCMATWSVLELEAHIARTLVSHRDASWPMTLIKSAITRLAGEQRQTRVFDPTHRSLLPRAFMLQRYTRTLTVWKFLTDVKADVKVARVLGSGTLLSLTYKTALAQVLTPMFIPAIIEPAVDNQALLPIADSYAACASAVDPDGVILMPKKDRPPTANSLALCGRLRVLSALPTGAAVHDPRLAKSLFADFKAVEREVAANEFGFQRIQSAVDVDTGNPMRLDVIARIRAEVKRNRALVEAKTRFDIPQLLTDKAQLARDYKASPKFLLEYVQRVRRIPYLLGAFLTVSLMDESWGLHYHPSEGIQLRMGERRIRPFKLVTQLDTGKISEADFFNILTSPPQPSAF